MDANGKKKRVEIRANKKENFNLKMLSHEDFKNLAKILSKIWKELDGKEVKIFVRDEIGWGNDIIIKRKVGEWW